MKRNDYIEQEIYEHADETDLLLEDSFRLWLMLFWSTRVQSTINAVFQFRLILFQKSTIRFITTLFLQEYLKKVEGTVTK